MYPTTTAPTTTSTTDDLTASQRIKELEDENYRLKVGLGVGLGGGMAATTGLAVGSYMYYAGRYSSFIILFNFDSFCF